MLKRFFFKQTFENWRHIFGPAGSCSRAPHGALLPFSRVPKRAYQLHYRKRIWDWWFSHHASRSQLHKVIRKTLFFLLRTKNDRPWIRGFRIVFLAFPQCKVKWKIRDNQICIIFWRESIKRKSIQSLSDICRAMEQNVLKFKGQKTLEIVSHLLWLLNYIYICIFVKEGFSKTIDKANIRDKIT